MRREDECEEILDFSRPLVELAAAQGGGLSELVLGCSRRSGRRLGAHGRARLEVGMSSQRCDLCGVGTDERDVPDAIGQGLVGIRGRDEGPSELVLELDNVRGADVPQLRGEIKLGVEEIDDAGGIYVGHLGFQIAVAVVE